MKKLFKDRLLKLAAHLEKGKLGHDKFDFGVWHKVNCKSAGCALGECPTIWPRAFQFGRLFREPYGDESLASVKLRGTRKSNEDAAQIWFGITEEEAYHLFTPSYPFDAAQKPKLYGGKIIYETATRKQVATNIRAFVKKKEDA